MIKKLLFIGIVLVATLLRFVFLSSVPPSPSLDEATIGWNAFSLLHIGRDEYGYFFPLLLRAYDDYRPALYVYLVIPFVKLFGLQVLSVRLPAVIMSIATVSMSFFLVKNLFPTFSKRTAIAFLSMFLLTISPWHIYVSRLGHEVNLGLTLTILSLLLFFIALNKKSNRFLFGAFGTFALSFYSYQSEKVFIPLIMIGLFIIFWRELFSFKRYFILSIAFFVVITIPIFFASLSPGALLRLKGTSVFSDNPAYVTSAKNILLAQQKGDAIGKILNNRRIVTGEIFLQNYFSHLNPFWLFGNSGEDPFKAPDTGILYVWEAPFLFVGILYLLLSRIFYQKTKIFLIFWVFADFIAPGLTTQAPHALRAYTLLPVPQILTALGIVCVIAFFARYSKTVSVGIAVVTACTAGFSLYLFCVNYFFVFPKVQSESFQYALQQTMRYVAQQQNAYPSIVISNKNNLYQSYMFYLFYTQYSPEKYLASGGTKSGGFNERHQIGNITFRPIQFAAEKNGTFLIGNPLDFPPNLKPLFVSSYLDGKKGVEGVVK